MLRLWIREGAIAFLLLLFIITLAGCESPVTRFAREAGPNVRGAEHYTAGIGLKIKGDVNGAIGEFRILADLNPEVSIFHFALAEELKVAGDYNAAILEYRKSLISKPNDWTIHLALSLALMDKRDLESAIVEGRKAVALYDLSQVRRFPSPHMVLGKQLQVAGDFDGAEKEFQKEGQSRIALDALSELEKVRLRANFKPPPGFVVIPANISCRVAATFSGDNGSEWVLNTVDGLQCSIVRAGPEKRIDLESKAFDRGKGMIGTQRFGRFLLRFESLNDMPVRAIGHTSMQSTGTDISIIAMEMTFLAALEAYLRE